MIKRVKSFWAQFLQMSLWGASIGLMLASSGIDGAYLTKLMPAGWAFLGLVLNTVSDIASEVMMYWYGRLQMDRSKPKRRNSRWVLLIVGIQVGYAWLFSWRQLLPPLRELEQQAAGWLSMVMAAFVPISLVGIGYVQALLAGRIEKESDEEAKEGQAEPTVELVDPFACPHCSRSFASQSALNAHSRVHKQNRSNGHRKEPEPEREKAVV